MIHNNMVDLNKIKTNIEDAINSKLINLMQNSGRAEMHSAGFNSLFDSLSNIERMIAESQPKVEEPKAPKKTQ